jgi:hypothetical protein
MTRESSNSLHQKSLKHYGELNYLSHNFSIFFTTRSLTIILTSFDDTISNHSRERNRMHAKMTRDRKKLFINSVEKTISDLEENNKRMRQILAKQALRHSPCVTPDFAPVEGNPDNVPSITIEALTPKKLSE